ncbi:MAG: calcineurin-like phosphoesterase family protein, partial [Candidatus Cryptobacteroides sp.]|nr:calcineurin-like phosphoesterase family protein [Candidatus Cryptobacteroides sp.]
SSSFFDVNIAALWDQGFGNGNYTVSIRRGQASRKMGQMQVVVKAKEEEGLKPAAGSSVYGKVICGEEGVPDVVISDGVQVVKTDKDGVYQLASAKYHKYVFMSVPSGYEPLRSGILPVIHSQLSQPSNVAERVDFQLRKVSGQENHTMLMLGDIHLANRTGDRNQFKSFVNDINAFRSKLSGPVYALTLGDMTWDLYWEVNNYGYKDYLADAKAIADLTIYQTIGNHDHSMYQVGDYNTVEEYKKVIGPTYYSFNIGKVHYVVLDDVECTNSKPTTDEKGNACYVREYNANLVQQQYDWLAKDLSYVDAATPIVVAMHIPLYNDNGSARMTGASKLAQILSAYPEAHVYTAHTHTIYNVDKTASGHIFEHNAGSICGTWWWSAQETPGIHIGQDGSPGGYSVVNVAGTSFSWQYKATGSDIDRQFRTYDRNSISITASQYVPNADASHQADFKPGFWSTSSSANEVYINVWNWDPSWKVEVKEGGKALTVSKVKAYDPLHLVAYTAKRLNKNKTASFATTENRHMFKVTASSASSSLEIKVTDRFGNVYTETMSRPKAFNTDIYQN